MADTIRDMLSVGQVASGDWAIYRWDTCIGGIVATFPREEEAWGVTSLILEYVETFGHTPDYAITCALHDYQLARVGITPLDNRPAPGDLAYQDHAHAMGYVS